MDKRARGRQLRYSVAIRDLRWLSSGTYELIVENLFNGPVTEYMECYLPRSNYDFYLCGNGAMLHDATAIVDRFFPTSRIYSEMFYSLP